MEISRELLILSCNIPIVYKSQRRKLRVSSVINTTIFTNLQLAMVGSQQRLHVSAHHGGHHQVVLTNEDILVQFASNRKYDVKISNTLTFIDLTVSNITVSMQLDVCGSLVIRCVLVGFLMGVSQPRHSELPDYRRHLSTYSLYYYCQINKCQGVRDLDIIVSTTGKLYYIILFSKYNLMLATMMCRNMKLLLATHHRQL